MARVKYSAIGVTDIKGTSGGTVFQGALGGGVIRRRVKPVNTKSNAQVAQRSVFSQNAQAWRALTDAQRAAWEGAAKSGEWPFRTLMGDKFDGSGSQLYSAVNNAIISAEGAIISAPALKVGLGNTLLAGINVAVTGPLFEINYGGTIGTDESLVLFATATASPGRVAGGNFKKVTVFSSADLTDTDIYTEYVSVFGTPTVAGRVTLKAMLVNKLTGESRQAGRVSGIVAA